MIAYLKLWPNVNSYLTGRLYPGACFAIGF